MRAVAVALIGVVIVGCVPKQYKEAQASTDAQVTLLQTRQAVLEQGLEESTDKLEQAQSALRVIGRDKGDLLQALDQASDQVRSLRGELETLRFDLDEIKQSFEAYLSQQEVRQLHDEARLKQIETSLGLQAPPRPTLDPGASSELTGGEATDPVVAPTDMPDSAKGLLDKAIGEMEANRQGVARFLLEKAVKEYAGDPVLDEVRYRLGETWALEKTWNKAALAFDQVVNNHPKSKWAAWAMLRQGEAFEQLGQKDGAMLFYEDVVRLYPKTEAANEARKKVRELK